MLCQAADDAEKLKRAFDQFAAQLPANLHAMTSIENGLVSLSIDDAAPPGSGEQTLGAFPAFKSAAAQVATDGTMFTFINVDAARNALVQMVTTSGPPSNAPNWAEMTLKFLASSGLNNVHAVAMSEGFKDRNWQTEAFLAAPSPRKGLLSLGDFQPIDRDLQKRIPAGAYMASQVPLDLEKLLTVTRQITADTYPPAHDMLDKALGAATLAVGKNIESDLLQSLGTQWAIYTAPQVGGSSMLGMVMVNKLSNVLKAKQSIGTVDLPLQHRPHLHARQALFAGDADDDDRRHDRHLRGITAVFAGVGDQGRVFVRRLLSQHRRCRGELHRGFARRVDRVQIHDRSPATTCGRRRVVRESARHARCQLWLAADDGAHALRPERCPGGPGARADHAAAHVALKAGDPDRIGPLVR